jgi:GWxTD domain-containing protein
VQPLRDRLGILLWVACLAASAPAGAQAPATPAAPAPAAENAAEAPDQNGVVATALQPGVARGDFEFFVDALSQSPAGTQATLVRCIVQLPVRAFLDLTKANKADLRLRVRAYEAEAALARLQAAAAAAPVKPKATAAESSRAASARGDDAAQDVLSDLGDMPTAGQAESRAEVEAADRQQLLETDYRIFELALELPPADYVVEVTAENLSRRKRGLLDKLRRRPMAASAKLLVRVPDLRRAPALADPAFLVGHGARSPYATRLYGLLNDSLHVRTTIYGRGSHLLQITATDRGGDVGWRDSLRLEVDGAREVTLGTSVNTLPAGQHVLQLAVTGPQGTARIARSFDVAWSLVTWKRSRRDLNLEAELALDEKRYGAYRNLPVGEKEKYLENFWKSIDPTPETAQNEVMDEFHRRVAYADLNFSETVRGALTDRGRVYIHFGAPTRSSPRRCRRIWPAKGRKTRCRKSTTCTSPRSTTGAPRSTVSAPTIRRSRRPRAPPRSRSASV